MDPLVIFALAWLAHSAWDHMRADYTRSRDAFMGNAAKKAGGTLPADQHAAATRHHARGYIAREVAGGFPAARTGLRLGWLAHRAAVTEAQLQHADVRDTADGLRDQVRQRREARRAAQEQAITEGKVPQDASPAEAAQTADEVAAARERRRQKEAEGSTEGSTPYSGGTSPGPVPPLPADAVKRPDTGPRRRAVVHDLDEYEMPASLVAVRCPRCKEIQRVTRTSVPFHCPACGLTIGKPNYVRLSSWVKPGDPLCETCKGTGADPNGPHQCPECRGFGTGPGDPDGPEEPDGICGACGNPARPGDPVIREPNGLTHRSHILDDIAERQHVRAAGRSGDLGAVIDASPTLAGPRTSTSAPIDDAVIDADHSPIKGETVPATDTTYYGVHLNADSARDKAENAAQAARQAQAAAMNDADAMTAAGVDAEVIDAQMTLADLQERAAAAQEAVLEQTGVVKTSLAAKHGDMQAAHDDAPGAIATREFHSS